MKRREFFRRVGAGVVGAGAVLTCGLAPDPDAALAREVAVYRAWVERTKQEERWSQGLVREHPAIAFATLRGDRGPQGAEQERARAACLTNRRLRKMVEKFNARTGGDSAGLHATLTRYGREHAEYFRWLRAYWGLDYRAGWLERELAA